MALFDFGKGEKKGHLGVPYGPVRKLLSERNTVIERPRLFPDSVGMQSSSTLSGQVIKEGDIGVLSARLLAEDAAGHPRWIPAYTEVKVSKVYPTRISFITGKVIKGGKVFVALPLEFGTVFSKK